MSQEIQKTDLDRQRNLAVATNTQGILQPNNLEQYMTLAFHIIKSGLAPSGLDTYQKVMIAMMAGAELGLPAMTAVKSIAVIKGRPALWGPVIKQRAYDLGLIEFMTYERYLGKDKVEKHEVGFKQNEIDDNYYVKSIIKRKNLPEDYETFSVGEAKNAGLWGQNTYRSYFHDMLAHRADSRAVKKIIPEVLGSCWTATDAQDAPFVNPEETIEQLSENIKPAADKLLEKLEAKDAEVINVEAKQESQLFAEGQPTLEGLVATASDLD